MKNFKDWWYWNKGEVILFGIIGMVVLGALFLFKHLCEYETKLQNQCLDDGHKEYECRAMLRSNYRPTHVNIYRVGK